ncbi:DNA-binding protein [Herbaspirillum sp. RV1423]|uniref:DNA-binding protein n=1 Tax=Herbaspirillum sp. RV1423 TaxID=1443993 RepID=UPI0004BC5DB0|nr:DNA-binding protein [Herbaspirillum sp. RV1423]
MARSGLLKSDVKKARDSLVAQRINPSVDAVRVALGNTGSKTTIHKYLKELEEDGTGSVGTRVSLSEALQDLVARLAAQLQSEADTRIDEIRTLGGEKERQHAATIAELQATIIALKNQVSRLEADSFHERTTKTALQESLQQETVARHTAEQQVNDLKERLAENESHRQSLEEKHQHAREALEHYRQSVKEQRDQDQRRHEQQVQQLQAEMRRLQQSIIVKQDEVTRLNQEAARLVGELNHAQKQVYDQQLQQHQLAQKIESLQAIEQHYKVLELHVSEKNAHAEALREQLALATSKADHLNDRNREMELALAAMQAKLDAQQGFTNELRAYLDARESPANSSP